MGVYKNKWFRNWAKSERLEDPELSKASNEIEKGLIDANLGGDLIKKRVRRKGKGKRAGFRAIVVFQKGYRTIFVYGFAKNQRDNISERDRQALKKLGEIYLNASEKEVIEMIAKGELFEVKNEKEKKASKYIRSST